MELGEGDFFRQRCRFGNSFVGLKVDVMGKTFSSSFVWDCSSFSVIHVNVDIES